MSDYYRGKTVLLTGASAGIGREMARQLSASGARLLLVARSEDVLHELAASLVSEAIVYAADLEPHDAADALVDRLEAAGETVDVLINNAGYGLSGLFLSHASGARGMVDLNVATLTQLTARLLPGMVKRRSGGVLNVASLGSFMPLPRLAVYGATKAYVRSFTEALHQEMRGSGVHISALNPGPVKTSFADRSGMDDAYFEGSLPVEEVARQGLAGLAANKRRVVPGWLTKIQSFVPRLSPVGLGLALTEYITKKAG